MTILDPSPRRGHDGRDANKPDPGAYDQPQEMIMGWGRSVGKH